MINAHSLDSCQADSRATDGQTMADYLDTLDSCHTLTHVEQAQAAWLESDDFAAMLADRDTVNYQIRHKHSEQRLVWSSAAGRLVRPATAARLVASRATGQANSGGNHQ